MTLTLNADRLWNRLERIATFTRPDVPWTRRAFSPEFETGRRWLQEEFRAAGLNVRLDTAGNLIGTLSGRCAHLPPLATGSHTDTVLGGGRFDGVLGVLAGLEVAQSLRESGRLLRHPLEVIDFLSEEPSDYGVSCVGSRAMAGTLVPDMLALSAPCGETLHAAMQRVGARPDALAQAVRAPGDIAAFVELHIEQGPVLEQAKLPIGVVTHIVGIRRVAITVEGRADHAGTTPLDLRQDALVGGAHVVSTVRAVADRFRTWPWYVVATVGRLDVLPNASNAVPGRVEMVLEVRSDSAEILEVFPETVMAECQPELSRLQLRASVRQLSRTAPTPCSNTVMAVIEQAAADLHLPCRRLPSGAGHDSLHLAAVAPIGMVFVPCREGRSHCPEEWIDKTTAASGARVLAGALLGLDRQLA